MAIELHHLNTHGMMEQACDVLDGVVRLKERIAKLESTIEKEKSWSETLSKNGVTMSHEIERLKSENERMKAIIAKLEEERRWRKFSEGMPEEDTWCIVFHDGEIDSDHYTRFTYNKKCDFAVYGYEVTHWMPLPAAPKEEK